MSRYRLEGLGDKQPNAAISYLLLDSYTNAELAELVEHRLEEVFWKKLEGEDPSV